MTWKPSTLTAVAAAALALGAATGATAATMHPQLGAHLSGMGEHGVVNLALTSSSGKLCWTFDIPTVKSPTLATIHTGASGPILLEFGMHYTKRGCEKESAMTLEHLEAKPGSYSVWVNTAKHMGEVRGTLSVGMAHM